MKIVSNNYKGQRFADENKDCTVIALSLAADIPYSIAHHYLRRKGRATGYGINFVAALGIPEANITAWIVNARTGKITEERAPMQPTGTTTLRIGTPAKEFTLKLFPRPRMTVKTFCKKHRKGTYVVLISGHAAAVVNGKLYECNPNAIVKRYILFEPKTT